MIKEKEVSIILNSMNISFYEGKGYYIPRESRKQERINSKGIKKSYVCGSQCEVKRGTSILVKVVDLQPSCCVEITRICDWCGKEDKIRFNKYNEAKKIGLCRSCANLRRKEVPITHAAWRKRLISNNPHARCDISGETDKRFLELHHLLNVAEGGSNDKDNYVILSANYHRAFHTEIGGTKTSCTREDYLTFKCKELTKLGRLGII